MASLKFKMDMQWFKFDVLGYEKGLHKFMEDYTCKAGKVWLHAATESIPLPTWSGATRASFQKLARALGTTVPIGTIRSKKDRSSLGKSTSVGNLIIDEGKNFYGFEWGSDLRYLNYNEFNSATPGRPPRPTWRTIPNTPYGFQAKALEAWKTFTQNVDLPEPMKTKFLKRFKIS